jgi:AcrR family transcriptional regulator
MATNAETARAAPDAAEPPTRERILRSAATLFRTQGFAATTMRNVAGAAGLTPGALYWHFPSKEAILYDILVSLSDEWHAVVDEVMREPTPRAKLASYVREQIHWELRLADEGHALLAVHGPDQLKQFLTAEQRDFISGRQNAHFEALEDILREGVADGIFRDIDTGLTAHAIYDMGSRVPSWWRPDGGIAASTVASAYTELVMRMVAAE